MLKKRVLTLLNFFSSALFDWLKCKCPFFSRPIAVAPPHLIGIVAHTDIPQPFLALHFRAITCKGYRYCIIIKKGVTAHHVHRSGHLNRDGRGDGDQSIAVKTLYAISEYNPLQRRAVEYDGSEAGLIQSQIFSDGNGLNADTPLKCILYDFLQAVGQIQAL